MKEKIYTIPVTDGFTEGGECPFCNMRRKLERDAVEFMLGPSYMEDDIRMETNEKGFCARHYTLLFDGQNRLGLALMLHTHLQHMNKRLAALSNPKHVISAQKGLFKKAAGQNPIAALIQKTTDSCYICERIDRLFARYVDTYFYLWGKDENMWKLTEDCAGFCLPHYALLLTEGERQLSAAAYEDFCTLVIPLQLQNLKRIEDDLDWFIKKFDYRFKDEPWKNARDSVPRAIAKVAAHTAEPAQKDDHI